MQLIVLLTNISKILLLDVQMSCPASHVGWMDLRLKEVKVRSPLGQRSPRSHVTLLTW